MKHLVTPVSVDGNETIENALLGGNPMKNYYDNRAQSFSREHFDSLMLEIAYRYNVPELELLNFYGAKKIREFKKSHKSLFVR